MFEYKFYQVQVGALNGKPKENYEDLVKTHALEGWKLHTFQPLPFSAGGQAQAIQLIFERPIER